MINGLPVIPDGTDKIVQFLGDDVERLPAAFDAGFSDKPLGVAAEAGSQAPCSKNDIGIPLYQPDGQAIGFCRRRNGKRFFPSLSLPSMPMAANSSCDTKRISISQGVRARSKKLSPYRDGKAFK